jgi:probable F420-dependent oxidoreductase
MPGEIMPRPFRFGVQLHDLPVDGWAEQARRIEALGYSTAFCPDHLSSQWDPTTLLSAVAAVTERLHVGTLVYDVDYRHPVIYAKAAATLQLISGGRHEFGLGAGWMKSDYDEAGLVYDSPGTRIGRLEEALQIIRAMWTQERTSFEGQHYRIHEIARAAALPVGGSPKILVGGGGPRVLRLAGRWADIVGINARMDEGQVTAASAADQALERVREKIRWMREGAEAAGRSPDEIELNMLVFVVAIADDVRDLRQALATSTGLSVEQVRDCPLFLTGSKAEIQDRLLKQREETGISYIVIQGGDNERVDRFAEEIVKPLTRERNRG